MASINGLQNNALVVNTIDGLTTIYASAIYDDGTLITPGNYVPYTNASTTVDLAGQDLKNVANFSTLSAYATQATIGSISTTGISTNTLSTGTLYLTNAVAGTPATYIALDTLGKAISYTPSFEIPSTLSTVTILASTATISSIYASSLLTGSTFGGTTKLSTLTVNDAFVSSLTFSTFTQVANAPLSINGTLTSAQSITASYFYGNLSGTATNAINLQLDAPTTQTIYLAGGFSQGSGTNQRIYNSILNYDVGAGILSTPQIRLSATPSDTIVSNKYLGLNTAGSTVLGTAGGGGGQSIYSTLFTSTLTVYSTATISSLSANTIAVASSLTCSSLNTLPFGTGLFATNTSVAIAPNALKATTTGVDNIAIGFNSLTSVTTGGNNTAVGWTTGFGLVDGVNNVMIGTSAGGNIAKLDNGVYIGANAIGSATLASNEIAIGYNTQGKGNNTVILGNTSHTKLYIPPVIQTINGTNMVFSTSVNSTISTVINGTTITTISTNGITLVNPASTLRTTGNKMALVATSSVNVESRLVVNSGIYTDSIRALPGGGGTLLLGVLGSTNSYLYCYDTGYVQANGYFQSVAGAFTSYNTALTISSANTGIIMKSGGTTFATIDNVGLTLGNGANYLSTDATISTLLVNGTSTIQMQTSYVSKVEVNPQGLSMITKTGGAGITSASYNATTLILTVNYTFAPFGAVAGSWVTVTGLSPSALNGTYQLITFSAGSATMQNYYGTATAVTLSSPFLQLLTTATQGIVFGDSTFKATAKAPIVSIIRSSTAIATTPLALSGTYTTPIGAKYLKVRMVGAGGGGGNRITAPYGANGGYTQFGSYYAYGGQVPNNEVTGAAIMNSAYPFWYFAGGQGGGYFNTYTVSRTATTGSITLSANFSNLMLSAILPASGTTVYMMGFQPTSWNGAFTIASCTTTVMTFTSSGLPATTQNGYFSFDPPDSSTILVNGNTGGGSILAQASPEGGVSAFGGYAPPGGVGVNPYGYPANFPSQAYGTASYGCGGKGSFPVGGLYSGGGGGAGQYIETIINNPTTSYTYTIGLGGVGGNGDAGQRYQSSSGGNGLVVVEAFF